MTHNQSLTASDLHRAAGLEKIKAAIREHILRMMEYSEYDADEDTLYIDGALEIGPLATAALAAWEAHVSETWPTPEMCGAGAMAIVDTGMSDFIGSRDKGSVTMSARLNSEEAAKVFRAMLAAAKQKEAPAG